MAELTVDMTYGQALLEAAREVGKEKLILEEGEQVLDILKEESDLRAFIAYPGISAEDKKAVITNIFGGKVCEELLNFLYVLMDKRRGNRFEGIMKVYRNLYEKEEGVSYGTVYSVAELTDEQLKELEEQTSKLLRTKVQLNNELDPKLMAGVKIMIDGKIIDASFRKKFDEMASQMRIS